MKSKKFTKFMGDFETTVYSDQEYTEVWASALVPFYSEEVEIFHSIDDTFEYLYNYPGHVLVYYHNLKFDGEFWMSYLLNHNYKLAIKGNYEDGTVKWKKERDMLVNEYKYFISDRGLWYYITIKTNKGFIEIRDSLKLLPFSVKQIGKDFKTKHQKLDMEYKGFRYAGCEITEDEKEYIKNDVLVVKEALEFLEEEGHDKLTIGSCCFKEFKSRYNRFTFQNFFPDVYEYNLDPAVYSYKNIGDYIRKSYKGGWCYVVPEKQGKLLGKGCTIDVNSLYPSMMHSMSGNYYPVGLPIFWTGNYIPDEALQERKYFFIRIKTRFYVKDGYLPFIQIKGSLLYRGTENLTSSDMYDRKRDMYFREYIENGEVMQAIPTLTLTMTDYYLFLEHYDVEDFEILDGCYFEAKKGLFDGYIDKYKEIKMTSKGAKRQEAKLFLNNLYGKMATSPFSAFKLGELNDDGVVDYYINDDTGKKPGYIPIGSAITSYARNFTIRAAQKNYHPGKGGFCYADTDSLHCDISIGEIAGVELDDNEFCKWAHESNFEKAIFVRQKTYLEVIGGDIDIKCAGMPQRSKELLKHSINQDWKESQEEFTEDEIKFMKKKRTIKNFKRGLKVPGKLRPKRIPGGVVLVDVDYEIR